VKICKELLKVKAEHVLDPTFLLEKNEYLKLIESEKVKKLDNKYIAYFTLDETFRKKIFRRHTDQ